MESNPAREKAVEYLGRFARSERQVKLYLRRKQFTDEQIADAIAYLREHRYLNDSSFAEMVINERIRRCDGPLKIKQALFQKGIDSSTADRLLREMYPQELQVEAAATLLAKKLRKASERERAMRFVASRGFSRYVIIQALKSIPEEKES